MRFRPQHILIALSAAACLLSACRHEGDGGRQQHRNLQSGAGAASVNWRDSAEKRYDRLVYYYNENLHDSLVMLARADLEFLSDKEQWNRYYDTWMLLAEDYTFNGEFTNAIREAQLIHADARQRNSRHGLTVAEYIKGLVYDGQQNHQESARSLHEALRQCPDLPTLKNNIYAYYMTELKLLNDTLQMRHTIDEWAQYIDMAGSSLVSANEILGYRMELAIARHDYGHALQLADQLYFCVGDVSGKGVPASLFMAQTIRLLTVLRHTRYASARQVIDSMQHEVDAHRAGAPLNDDLTMMCLKIA